MSKIDIHTHILPPQLPDMKKISGYGGWIQLKRSVDDSSKATMVKDNGQFFRSVNENLWSLEKRLTNMNATGVKMQILSTVPVMFNYWAEPKDALYFGRLLNDHIADCVGRHPTRFAGLATLPLQDPSFAVQELKRCVLDLKLHGVQIGSHINNWNLDAEELDVVYKTAEDLGCTIFVHPWDMESGSRMNKYWLPWLVGMPSETTTAICSMIFGGVFERFPRLRVCFAHGGGAFPFTLGRIAHGFDVRPDLCATRIKINPRNYLSKIYVDSLVHDPDALEYLVKTIGQEHVMLGSDYPFPLGEDIPGHIIGSSMNFSNQLKQKLLADNAVNFFGLDPHLTIR